MLENADTIDHAATEWVARIDRGLKDDEEIALEQWLAADARCKGALERAQMVWRNLDRAQVFRIADDQRRAPDAAMHAPDATHAPRAAKGRGSKAAAYAAALAAAVIVSVGVWFGLNRNDLSTTVGEIRQVPLNDGSRVTLDTGSRIAVEYRAETRTVRLESGEALFEVAKDPQRPFVVQAGNIRVRALGTAFLVRRRSDDDVDVTVTKGVVDVWSETHRPRTAVRLKAGTGTSLTGGTVAPPQDLTARQIERAIDWKLGIVNLDGRTLGEAAAEINRYNRLRVVIPDPHLAAQPLVGNVSSSDPAAFAQAAAAMFDARVRSDGDRLIVEPLAVKK
jgi:transmembrane sensor